MVLDADSESSFLNKDCFDGLKDIDELSVHALISDIPYGIGFDDWDVLHSNTNSAYLGSSPAQARSNDAFKRRGKPLNGWSSADREISKQYEQWCEVWLELSYPLLKPGASVFIFAGRRYSHRLMTALENTGYIIKDQLAWIKPQAVHRAQRLSVVYERRENQAEADLWSGWRLGNLRPRFEPIIWATKPYKIGATIADNVIKHGVGAYNQSVLEPVVKDSSNILEIGMSKSEAGLHPTQKPESLMRILIELVTKPGQVVLDPFAGSATTLAAAKRSGRRYLGFELDPKYHSIGLKRLDSIGFETQLFQIGG